MNDNRLFTALRGRNLEEVRHVIENCGANPNAQYAPRITIGWCPLHFACSAVWRHFEIAKYLVEVQHVEVNVAEKGYASTPLHFAAVGKSTDGLRLVKLIAEAPGANIDAKNTEGCTPLHFACQRGTLDVIRYLIEERHADVNSKSGQHGSVLGHALRNRRNHQLFDIIAYLLPRCPAEHETIVDLWKLNIAWPVKEICLKNFFTSRRSDGADEHTLLSFETRPLHCIFYSPLPTEGAYQECVVYLGSRNKAASMLDDQGRLPLHVAIQVSKARQSVTPRILLRVLELEHRACILKDPTTGMFPFEAVAALGTDEELRSRHETGYSPSAPDEDDLSGVHSLDVVYLLFRHDPGSLLRNRGLGFCRNR